ncbi:MAG TPA: peptidoglycan-associated lipoprotein Pal [Thermodesulfobacteriota bacterium]|mgnify:CR=1 FL=1|nr:peptidoglycan-associated lipoprotein Pal [Deltaproteobacteria bacterium]HNR13809.1 peptidoglycan-associated lipoprotein Pal [Thermodesulfobacteriota bacterium]HNU72195.1 peptidoglycan-associated lipoprotein Pal [Thermodesulfobacteriota bacterium]HQO78834.1 peptidoglycan-associated lipoprotein Pal [Thermodesulfobacteriota bacterium]
MEFRYRTTTLVCAVIVALSMLAGCCGRDRKPSESNLPTETVSPPAAVAAETASAGGGMAPVKDEQLIQTAAEFGALATIYFDFDRSDIKPPADARLNATAAWLLKHPGVTIEIAGHCDERGTNEYNMALGERRANTTKKYLTDQGIPSTRMTTVSYGEEKPADPGHNEAAWSKNRRAEFMAYK